jgi:hypothetical protein
MKVIFLLLSASICLHSFSQIDSAFMAKIKALDTANVVKSDTMSVVDNALSKKIKVLLNEKRGLTIQAILRLKLMEEQQKDTTHSKDYYTKLLEECTTGKTGQLIENSLINLYSRTFTEKEIDDLINFYKTPAGKKMDQEYLLLLVESVKDLEQLLKLAVKKVELSEKK